jgi:putative ABC transport system permease protein
MYFFHELKEGLAIAYNAIMANKMRSALTTLGIIIGIVSVTLMGTAIEGLDRAFNTSISKIGADVLYIQKWPWFAGDDWWKYRNRREVEYKEALEFKTPLKGVEAVSYAAGRGSGKGIKYKDNLMTNIIIVGSDENYVVANGAFPESGRFFNAFESEGGRPVCVLGKEVADGLFPKEDPIGKYIRIKGFNYKIAGVLEKQGSMLGLFSLDTRIIIPMQQFMKMYGNRRSVQIMVKVGDKNRMEEAKEEVRGLMRKIRRLPTGKEDDFAINQQEAFTKTFETINMVISLVGLFITGLSLFVGSIGIMNVMFVSVTERTKEIGIRKALGAKRRTILLQFLIESATISLLGGLIGLIIAFPISLIINQILPTAMPLSIILIAIFTSLAIGIISGILPAMRASKLDPVDALRYE